MPIDSGLDIYTPIALPDGTYTEITINEEEKRQILNFNKTDHSFLTANEKGGLIAIRWEDPSLVKGTEKGTKGS